MIVGVLGGMGPRATVEFMRLVYEARSGVRHDREHVRLVVDQAVHVPSRTLHYLGECESPVPGMIEACRRLFAYGASRVVCPCNSAAHYLPAVRADLVEPIIGPIGSTVRAVKAAGWESALVLGGRVTWGANTYREPLAAQGIEVVLPGPSEQWLVEDIIGELKQGERVAGKRLDDIIRDTRAGADGVILACTEFSLVHQFPIAPFIDSNRALAMVVASWV